MKRARELFKLALNLSLKYKFDSRIALLERIRDYIGEGIELEERPLNAVVSALPSE